MNGHWIDIGLIWLVSGAFGALMLLLEPTSEGPFDEPRARGLWSLARTVVLGALGGGFTLTMGVGRLLGQRQ